MHCVTTCVTCAVFQYKFKHKYHQGNSSFFTVHRYKIVLSLKYIISYDFNLMNDDTMFWYIYTHKCLTSYFLHVWQKRFVFISTTKTWHVCGVGSRFRLVRSRDFMQRTQKWRPTFVFQLKTKSNNLLNINQWHNQW